MAQEAHLGDRPVVGLLHLLPLRLRVRLQVLLLQRPPLEVALAQLTLASVVVKDGPVQLPALHHTLALSLMPITRNACKGILLRS